MYDDCSGLVPLHNACSYGHYEVAELLVKVRPFGFVTFLLDNVTAEAGEQLCVYCMESLYIFLVCVLYGSTQCPYGLG